MKFGSRITSGARAVLRTWLFPYSLHLRRNRCIFIHIPKTAGTSILWALGKKSGGRDHLPWYVYYTANPGMFERYYKFCFVRNPWDRTYSAYKYLSMGGNRTSDLPIVDSILSFGSFDRFVVDGLGRGFYRSHLLFIPQSNFVVGHNEKVMVDFVGRYENIADDFEFISGRLGLTETLPNKNVSKHSPKTSYRDAYCCTESIAAIAEIYRQDILVFSYDFGGEGG